jgi:hypothetical protein
MKKLFLIFALIVLPVSQLIAANNAFQKNDDKLFITAGYDVWYANWEVENFAYSEETDQYGSGDFDIDPALIHGMSVSARKGYTKKGSWGLMVNYYSDQIGQQASEETDKKSEYFKALFSYVMSGNQQLLTTVQSGKFRGELDNEYQFETEWTKVDLLLAKPAVDRFFGYGIRFLKYEMPVEFAFVESGTGDDLGHDVYLTETQGIAFILKRADPVNFGYDNKKWYYLDLDVAFGISKAEADELKEDVYGFQFNAELAAGYKKIFNMKNGLFSFKLGYRVFVDTQILSEWENSDDENTTATLRNIFHGPFLGISGSF